MSYGVGGWVINKQHICSSLTVVTALLDGGIFQKQKQLSSLFFFS